MDASKIEVIQDDNALLFFDIENYLEYIQSCMDNIIKDYGLEVPISPSNFTFCLGMIKNRLYAKNKTLLQDYINIARYNPYKIYIALKAYIFLCYKYKMVCTIYGFVTFSGICDYDIYKWDSDIKANRNIIIIDDNIYINALNNGLLNTVNPNIKDFNSYNTMTDRRVTDARTPALKLLREASENGLQDLLLDKSVNPIKPLSVLNYRHGWADNRNRFIEQREALTADALPVLPTFSNQSNEPKA